MTPPPRPSSASLDRLSDEDIPVSSFQVAEFDPVINLLDNLSALLCCAFLHVDLVGSLFELCTNAKLAIAAKSRRLLVNFLRILADVLPENSCSELLTNPTLINIASSLGSSSGSSSRAHKASQLLVDLAEAFSIMPYKQTSGGHASNLSSLVSSSSKGRNGSITNKSANTGSIVVNPATVTSNKSNFLPLNIRTVFELTEEIKISSMTSSNGVRRPEGGSNIVSSSTSRALGVLNSLRQSLTQVVDKADFTRQMDISRVIGKEVGNSFVDFGVH